MLRSGARLQQLSLFVSIMLDPRRIHNSNRRDIRSTSLLEESIDKLPVANPLNAVLRLPDPSAEELDLRDVIGLIPEDITAAVEALSDGIPKRHKLGTWARH